MTLKIGVCYLHLWNFLSFSSSLIKGATSHKVIDLAANPILRYYYHNKVGIGCFQVSIKQF